MDVSTIRRRTPYYAQKARHLVGQMTLAEKVGLMSGHHSVAAVLLDAIRGHYNHRPIAAGGCRRRGIPPLLFCDGSRGVVSGHATCFPVAIQRGASFDVELEERVGQAIGREVRALGGNFFGGVCVNLLRHPAGGRSQETYGEDPFHVGQMGAAVTRGVQRHNVIACVKHYALNNQEESRLFLDVDCDERALREVYLPHFKACLDAGAAAVMSAYNTFRGEHLSESRHLLRTILKGEWGFQGFVISDFVWGVRDTVRAALGGLDVEMCNTRYYGRRLIEAVKRGEVPEGVVDEAAERIVGTLLLFAEARDPELYSASLVASPEHVALAREVAERSMVLLKNDSGVLPFRRETLRRVAVIGPLGDTANIGDRGSSQVHPPYVVTPLEGLRRALAGEAEVAFADGRDLGAARRLATSADAVVLVVGYTHWDEGEYIPVGPVSVGRDRDDLGLRAADEALIRAMAPLNPRTAVVLIGGSAILMESWKDAAPAILYAFYPGMEGGAALARVLLGEVNPGGKLPFTIPADPRHLPPFDKHAARATYDAYHGYTRLDRDGHTPAFAFGFGLSYTTFRLADSQFVARDGRVTATVRLTNTGPVTGDEVVQLYVGLRHSAVERPRRLLRGFTRISLTPGETRTVTLSCAADELRWYNPEAGAWELEAMPYELFIGTSSRDEDLLEGSVVLST